MERDSNYTYYFPLSDLTAGRAIDVVVLKMDGGNNDVTPEAWLTAYPMPYESRELALHDEL